MSIYKVLIIWGINNAFATITVQGDEELNKIRSFHRKSGQEIRDYFFEKGTCKYKFQKSYNDIINSQFDLIITCGGIYAET